MLRSKRWLVWKLVPKPDPTKKPDKVPYYASGVPRGFLHNGTKPETSILDTPEDWAQLVSYEDACAAFHRGGYSGLATALGPDEYGGHWQGADADNLPVEALQEGARHMVGYVEISPSGKGLHAIGYGRPFKTLGSNGSGIEAYSSGRYFTYTGKMMKDEPIRCIADFVEQKLAPYHARSKTSGSDNYAGVEVETVDAQVITELRYALTFLLADDRDLWIYIGHALKTLGEQGRALWMEWSRNVSDPGQFNPLDLNGRWNGFNPTNTSYRAVFKKAQDAGWINPNSNEARGIGAGTAAEQGNLGAPPFTANKDDDSEYVLAMPKLHRDALYGILGEVVDAACANSEAVPVSVAFSTLARFAASLGRTAYVTIDNEDRHLRINGITCGPTAKGRKGTSNSLPRKLMTMAEQRAGLMPLPVLTALSTGEGLISQLRDPYTPPATANNLEPDEVPGCLDKRLLCDVSEFGGVLAQTKREGGTLSTVIRDAFDGIPLTTPSKTAFARATDTHVCINASGPTEELVKHLTPSTKGGTSIEVTNGMMNRFMVIYSNREKLVPWPTPTPTHIVECLAQRLSEALTFGRSVGEVPMNPELIPYWTGFYFHLENKTHPPIIASLLARQATYARVLAALLALMNREQIVERRHLDAAFHWLNYWEASVLFIFSSSQQAERAGWERMFDNEVTGALKDLGGRNVPHTELAIKATGNYKRKGFTATEFKKAIDRLQRASPPRILVTTVAGIGRPTNCYSLTEGAT